MLTIEAKVNGRRIGVLYIHNKGSDLREDALYDAAFSSDGDSLLIGIEDVPHQRSEGAWALVRRVLEKVL